MRDRKSTATTEGEGLLERCGCFLVAPLPLMAQAEKPVGTMEVRVQFHRSTALRDRQVVFAAEVIQQTEVRVDRQRERV